MQVKHTKRQISIDFIRGVAVFLVLWGHAIQYSCLDSFDFFENIVFKFIYSVHMPLFMLVSGYLFSISFKKKALKNLLPHRIQSLLQPIIMWNHILLRNLWH